MNRPHISVSRWDVCQQTRPCHSCGEVIGAGEQVRLVGPARWPFCAACAKRRFDLEPPPAMPALTTVEAIRADAGWRAMRANVVDFRARQIAREPGEEG